MALKAAKLHFMSLYAGVRTSTLLRALSALIKILGADPNSKQNRESAKV
jgi:hypothetical protein